MQQQSPESHALAAAVEQEVGRNQGQVIGQMQDSQAIAVQEIREGGCFIAGNVIFQNSRPEGTTPSPYFARRELPSLLPYLANRIDQEFELGQAIQKYLQQAFHFPLVCVVHGDEFQSHDKFLERLQKLSIPKLLGLDSTQTKIKEYTLGWPASSAHLDNLTARLCQHLADTVLGYSFSSLEDINQAFCQYPGPVIVHTHLLTEDWQQSPKAMRQILEFWQNWPRLLPEQKLVICLFIKYQVKRPQNCDRFSLTWLFSYLKFFWRQRRYQRMNAQIDEQIEALKTSDYQQFDRLCITVLPKLSGVSRTHVENWARSEATKQFVGEAKIGKLMDAIGEMFESWEAKTSSTAMPMEDLADHLIDLLSSLVTTEGGTV